MKSRFTFLLLLAGLSGMAFSTAALSDQAEADCQVRAHGDAKPKQSGPCTFSQRQGYIGIRLNNGKTYKLSPTDEANTFRDQDGKHVRRVEADGNMHKYKWDNSNITVYFSGNSSGNDQQGHPDSGYGSSGSDAWFTRLVGAASDGAENQLDINGFRPGRFLRLGKG